MKFSKVQQDFHALGGGLDMLTPAIEMPEGMVIDAQNYEPEITGGYRRIDGYEAFDGHTSPTSATYSLMTANITGTLAIGNTVTGGTSAATAKILNIVGSTLVLGRVVGTFVSGEALKVSGVTQATATSAASQSSASQPSDDADYTLLAANDLRTDIGAVPGSGPIRGVWVYKDTVYAFRDNVGASAGLMYKATAAGWVLVAFGQEIQFSSTMGGSTPIAAGATIGNLGAAPTKTATVIAVLTRSGTWGADAKGTLIVTTLTGSAWSNAEAIFVGATQQAVSTAAQSAIARLPGGRLDFVNANFTSSASAQKVYGADGVNFAFEFDGVNYIPIRTGMAVDTPTHVMYHRGFLFLSFLGSAQISGIGNPYAWTAVTGAAELACGDDITGFLPQGGSSAGSALAIFTKSRTDVLYGSGSSTWNLVTSIYDIGYSAFTMQPVSNNTYGLTPRGIQCLLTTLTYGDFDYASVAHKVMPYMAARRGLETASTSLRTKDQYRIYYSDGTALALGLTGDKVSGILPLNYGMPVRCITTATLSNGSEVTYFGSDDGFVYRDNIGTSFNGNPIESWIRLPFNHMKSPGIRKRYRRAILEVKATGYCKINISYDMGYGNPEILAAQTSSDKALTGGGGYWDQFTWESFTWDSAIVENPSLSLDGVEKNISFIFYSKSAAYRSHTLQGVRVSFTPLRLERY